MPRKLILASLVAIFSAAPSVAQSRSAPAPDKSTQTPQPAAKPPAENDDDLPEEDESLKPRVYPFDPLEAERNIKVGAFYMHQGTSRGYRAAAARFTDATRYNPQSGEAYFRLGEAEEKLKHVPKAKAAFQRAAQIAPTSKFGREAKRRLQASS